MEEPTKNRANVPFIPPLIPVVGLSVASVLQVIHPVAWGARHLTLPLGTTLCVSSVIILGLAIWELARAKTSFDVRRPTSALVSRGVFGVTRNPTYLAMLLACWGVGLVLDSVLLSVVAVPVGSALCLVIIRREEEYLSMKFGEAYAVYRRRVRRWI